MNIMNITVILNTEVKTNDAFRLFYVLEKSDPDSVLL